MDTFKGEWFSATYFTSGDLVLELKW
jgi:hypothetical protein